MAVFISGDGETEFLAGGNLVGLRSLLHKKSILSVAQRSSLTSIVIGTIPSISEAYYLDVIREHEGAGDPERALTSPNCPTRSTTMHAEDRATPAGALSSPIALHVGP